MRQLSSSFRVLSFCRFNERVLFNAILKAEGFRNFTLLARLSYEFLTILYDNIYGMAKPDENLTSPRKDAASKLLEDSERHFLSLRDLRLVVKLANLLRDQEYRVYHGSLLNLRES